MDLPHAVATPSVVTSKRLGLTPPLCTISLKRVAELRERISLQCVLSPLHYLPPTRLRAMNDFNASAEMEAVIAPR